VRSIASLVLAAGLAASSLQALELSGTAFCEKGCERITLQVFRLGGLEDKPLEAAFQAALEKTLPGGQGFRVEVGELPVRLALAAPGHAPVALDLWLPPAGPLPPAWLPAAKQEKVQLQGAVPAKVLLFGKSDAELGRWYLWVPPTWLASGKPTTVALPPGAEVEALFITPGGCYAHGRRAARAPLSGTLRCRPLAVTVTDPQGLPQAGVRVAAEGSPLGTAAVTGADGQARLAVPERWEGKVVALAGERGGWATARGEKVRLLLRPLSRLRLVTAQPYPGLLVRPTWFPQALLGGPLVLGGEGGEVAFLEGGGVLRVEAPGYEPGEVSVESSHRPVGVRLVPRAVVQGQLLGPDGRPAPGVPVWQEAAEGARILGTRVRMRAAKGLLPAWVTDSQGAFGPLPTNPGEARFSAAHPSLGLADSSPVQLKPGERRSLTLTLARGTTLALRVVDERGTPIPGVVAELRRGQEQGVGFRVRFASPGEPPLAQGESDRQGKVMFPSLLPGNYELLLSKEGFVRLELAVELPPQGKDLGDTPLAAGVTLSGRVVDEQGQGVAEALVLAGSSADFPVEYHARTQADGTFQLPDLPREGVLYLQARTGQHTAAPVKVTMPPAGPVELKVQAGKALKGRVVDGETGQGIGNASIEGSQVLLRTVGGFTVQTAMQLPGAESDEDGFFEVPLREGGEVRLAVRAPGYAPAQRTVVLKEDEGPRLLVVQLARGFTLRGTVWESDGRPAVGVTVSAREAGERSPLRFAGSGEAPLAATTDGNGQFAIEGLPPGKTIVEATSPEGAQDRVTLEVTGDAEVELRLAAPSSLEVRVVGPQGEPLPGAKVEGAGRGELPAKLTDAAGVVRYEELPPGSYQVVASLEGYAREYQVVTVGDRPSSVTLRLAPGGEVSGVVRGLSPQELARCQVWAGAARTQVSPADGTFRLTGVALGQQEVTAAVFPLGRARRATVEVRAGVPAEVVFDFSQGFALSGVVRRGSQGVAGYLVAASGPNPMERASDTTDERGSFRLAGLSAGRWQVSVADPHGQVLLTREVELQRDTQVELALPEGTLIGRVASRASREAIEGAEVTLELEEQSAFRRRTTTDHQGAFSFRELPANQSYRIRAQARGFAPGEATVSMVGQTATAELFLEPQKLLELAVRDEDGGIPGEVFLLVQSFSGEVQPLLVPLDREGKGVVSSLPGGEYVALVQGQGAAVVRFAVPSQLAVQLLPRGHLRLEGGQEPVAVQIFTAEGVPVPLRLRGFGGSGSRLSVQGTQRLGLPAGTYRVVVERAAGVEERTVTIAPGEETVLAVAP